MAGVFELARSIEGLRPVGRADGLGQVTGQNRQRGLVVAPVDWADVVSIGEHLSAQHTWTLGSRGFDILHVATALHLEASEFLTFARNQKRLTKAKGLRVPL